MAQDGNRGIDKVILTTKVLAEYSNIPAFRDGSTCLITHPTKICYMFLIVMKKAVREAIKEAMMKATKKNIGKT
jgi:hypothetical protein